MSHSPALAQQSWTSAWSQAWDRFWFVPRDPAPLAALRIAVGLIAFLHLWSFSYDLSRWFGPHGLASPQISAAIAGLEGESPAFRASHFHFASTPAELWVVHVAALLAAAAFTAGLATRASGILTLAALLSYVHGAPYVAGLHEPVLGMLLAYLCIAPAGACCSLDRLLGMPRWLGGSPAPSIVANVSLRLMQIHLAALYVAMAASKLYGDAWWDGQAIWMLMAQTHSRPLDLTFLRGSYFTLNFWTHFVLYSQLAFAPLVWNRLTRPLVLVAATIAWLSLIPVTGQVLFCVLMIVAGGVFLTDAFQRPAAASHGVK